MEHDTGATAADVLVALRTLGITTTPDDVAEHWQLCRALAATFNTELPRFRAEDDDAS